MTKNPLYKEIEKLCIDNDITKAELARKLGTTPQNLYKRLQTGKFTYEELEAIANILGCTFYYGFAPAPAQAIENR